jgi:hypothetical protein
MNEKLRRGCAALVLSWLSVLPITVSSSSPAAAQAQETKDFRDDFAGTSLRPEWTIINQDANRWAFVDNDYLLLVLKDEKNKFCYKRPVPDQYEFLIKVTITERLKSQVLLGKPIGSEWEVFFISIDNAKNEGTKLAISGDYNLIEAKEIFAFLKTVGADRPEPLEE